MSCINLSCGRVELSAYKRQYLEEIAEACGVPNPKGVSTKAALCGYIRNAFRNLPKRDKADVEELVLSLPPRDDDLEFGSPPPPLPARGETPDVDWQTPPPPLLPAREEISDLENRCNVELESLKDELAKVKQLLELCTQAKKVAPDDDDAPPAPPAPPSSMIANIASGMAGLLNSIKESKTLRQIEGIETASAARGLTMLDQIKKGAQLRETKLSPRPMSPPNATKKALEQAFVARRGALVDDDSASDEDEDDSEEWKGGGGRYKRRSSKRSRRCSRRSSKRSRRRSRRSPRRRSRQSSRSRSRRR